MGRSLDVPLTSAIAELHGQPLDLWEVGFRPSYEGARGFYRCATRVSVERYH